MLPLAWGLIAPEVSAERVASTQTVLNRVFGGGIGGGNEDDDWDERRRQALDVSTSDGVRMAMPNHMTVYGELGIDALVTLLDAVGVEEGDEFLDIGSGDGMLVTGAALLFSEHLKASRGIEILPSLYQRSLKFQQQTERLAGRESLSFCHTELLQGDIFQPTPPVKQVLDSTTLAVCFATTWSRGEPGRKLPQLSQALGAEGVASLPQKSRLLIIDGVLEETDGFAYQGQLKLQCPDTAPHSIARLYVRK